MSIYGRLDLHSTPIDRITSLIYPCQICEQEITDDDDGVLLELPVNIEMPLDRLTVRHIHVDCLLDAAKAVEKARVGTSAEVALAQVDLVTRKLDAIE